MLPTNNQDIPNPVSAHASLHLRTGITTLAFLPVLPSGAVAFTTAGRKGNSVETVKYTRTMTNINIEEPGTYEAMAATMLRW